MPQQIILTEQQVTQLQRTSVSTNKHRLLL